MHAQLIRIFGGSEGVRDAGLLSSALDRPRNRLAYGDPPPAITDLAAAYAYGISTNHPFVDGNKRVSMLVAFVFLETNGYRVIASQEEAYLTFLRLAAGELAEAELAQWFDAHVELSRPE